MIRAQYLTVTAIRVPNDRHVEYQVEATGCTDFYTMEIVSDEIKKQAGTYEYLPMETFLIENDLPLIISPGREPGTFDVRIGRDICIRDPKGGWGLLSASTEGKTAAEARRKLQEKISGQTLIANPMLPIKREIPVPDLIAQTTSPDTACGEDPGNTV